MSFKLLLIVFIGALLRFFKLDWGNGYFFHPDEYHLAAAVSRLSFPEQLNPGLFSYGSLSVYLIYFTKLIFNLSNSFKREDNVVSLINSDVIPLILTLISEYLNLTIFPLNSS